MRKFAIAGILGALAPAMAFAQANSNSALSQLKLSNDQPIQIESDNLQVDDANAMATFSGNVSVVQGQTNMKAGKMVIYYKKDAKGGSTGSAATGSSQIDHLEISDKIYVKSGTQVATGDQGQFDMNTNVLVLTGKEVVLSDGPNVLRGCKLTVLMDSGQAKVDGCGKRVQVLMNPNSAPKPAQ